MKNRNLFILVIAALSFAACKKAPSDAPVPGAGQGGKETKLTLKIKRASGLLTYAGGDLNATMAEITIDRIDVFIFDDGAPFGMLHHAVTNPALIYTTPGDAESALLPLTLDARTGRKRIYVGINLTPTSVNKIVENYSYLTDGINVVYADLVSGTGSLAMFNQYDFDDATPANRNILTITDGGANAITVNVSRLVSKVAVRTAGTFSASLPGGDLSSLEFTAGQTNNKLHLAPLKALFWDANWASFTAGDFNLNATDVGNQSYKAVAAGAFGDFELSATPKVYLPENTSSLHRHNEVSYVLVKATFTPTEDGLPSAYSSSPGPTPLEVTPGETFHAVFTNTHPGIGVHYYHENDLAQANAYASANAGVRLTYTDGLCYYRLYLNPTGASGNEYDILRNTFYKVSITKINTIGTPSPDQIPGGLGTPGFPGAPVIAELPAAVVGTDVITPPVVENIVANIDIVPWIDPGTVNHEF